jgi:hypothetical protein
MFPSFIATEPSATNPGFPAFISLDAAVELVLEVFGTLTAQVSAQVRLSPVLDALVRLSPQIELLLVLAGEVEAIAALSSEVDAWVVLSEVEEG